MMTDPFRVAGKAGACTSKGEQPVSYQPTEKFIFPKWANYFLPMILLTAIGAGTVVPPIILYGGSAETQNVGYQPTQPVPYSHALHVGKEGLDCRYCHNTVDSAAFASIPATDVCITCHAPGTTMDGTDTGFAGVHQNSLHLRPVWESWETGKAIPWVKVHDLADYAYFNHSAHVIKGVGCVSCHGRVDKMGSPVTGEEIAGVYQAHNLSMGWCLECHRAPEKFLRPLDQVTSMDWSPLDDARVQAAITAGDLREGDADAAQLWLGEKLKAQHEINNAAYMQACSTCHR